MPFRIDLQRPLQYRGSLRFGISHFFLEREDIMAKDWEEMVSLVRLERDTDEFVFVPVEHEVAYDDMSEGGSASEDIQPW